MWDRDRVPRSFFCKDVLGNFVCVNLHECCLLMLQISSASFVDLGTPTVSDCCLFICI